MQPTPPKPPRIPIVFVYVLGAVATAYIFYSTNTNTGLGGWLIALQIRLFGSASENLTVLVLFLALLAALSAVAQRFDPAGLAAFSKPRPVGSAPTRSGSFKLLAIIAAVPVAVAVPAYFWLQHQAEVDEHRQVYSLSLITSPAAPVPAEAKFVHLSAVFQADYQYVLTKTDNGVTTGTDRYVPLTGVDWQPSEPVRFFLDTSTSEYYDAGNSRTISFDQTTPFPGTFDGELGQADLPTVVRQNFERQHLLLADGTYVLNFTSSYGGRPPTVESHYYFLILWVGGGLSAMILLGGGIGLAIRRAR